jgi:hypothetical protein
LSRKTRNRRIEDDPLLSTEMTPIEAPKVVEPKPAEFPTPPLFVGWTYTAQQIEDFRNAYNDFKARYKQATGK